MTVWQKISGLATAVGDAGGDVIAALSGALGLNRAGGEPQKDVAFTIAVIALSAKMAKSDGIVSPLELSAFREVFRFAPEEAANVENVFNLAKQDTAGYTAYADQISGLLKDDRKLLQHVLEGLLHVAASDGILHPREDEFLKSIAARFVADHGNPYDALRLTPDASDAEVKAQYRKLVLDNHPDRLMANGVPAEFLELATRKIAAINVAYDAIARERGL